MNYDDDFNWLKSAAMKACACGHFQRSHRPISSACSLCVCPEFREQKPPPRQPEQATPAA